MDESYEITGKKVLDAQTDLLIEILARVKTLETIVIANLAKNQDLPPLDLANQIENHKEENRQNVCEYLYEKFGPDIGKI